MSSLFPDYLAVPRRFFVDMNAFYCSVEQQEVAAYRGKPTIVVPVMAENTCAIAASYEAKALGIRTGTGVGIARATSPDLQVVEARPNLYLQYHERIIRVLHDHFASIRALSIDEMTCRVPSLCQTVEKEAALARRVKAQIARDLGPYLTCSVGIGPNVFLAKVASDRIKPDGLTIWNDHTLPESLFLVKLGELPGIGPAMQRRLGAAGIRTTEALWQASAEDLARVWGGVVGERWYYMLRGSHECDYQPMQQAEGQKKKSVGHSNVLAPEYRTRDGARRILLELFVKALARIRQYGQAASAVCVTVKYQHVRGTFGSPCDAVWTRRSRRHLHASDEVTWLNILRPLVEAIPDKLPGAVPSFVGIVFSDLLAVEDITLSLFDEEEDRRRLAGIVDAVNRKHGRTLSLGAFHGTTDQIPLRIPFGAPEPLH